MMLSPGFGGARGISCWYQEQSLGSAYAKPVHGAIAGHQQQSPGPALTVVTVSPGRARCGQHKAVSMTRDQLFPGHC